MSKDWGEKRMRKELMKIGGKGKTPAVDFDRQAGNQCRRRESWGGSVVGS